MSIRTGRRPKYTLHGDFRMPMGFPADALPSALRYIPAESDVFVCTYPKCGTTWMQYIIYLLAHRGTELPAGGSLAECFPHLEEVGAVAVARMPPPRLIKTHLPFAMVPYRPESKYVLVVRNPYDCVVSFFHHTRGFVQHYDFAEGTFDDFFECFIAGEVDFGDYFSHLDSWYRAVVRQNVLLVTYERMHADLDAVIREVGAFLGGAAASTAADEALRAKVAAAAGFAGMSENQRRWSSARPAGMPEFVRKGVVGDWRNHLSPGQARRLTRELERRTSASGAIDLWPELVADVRRWAEQHDDGRKHES